MTAKLKQLSGLMLEAVFDQAAMGDALVEFGKIAGTPFTEFRVMGRTGTMLDGAASGPWDADASTQEANFRRENPRLKNISIYRPGKAVSDPQVVKIDEIPKNEIYQDFIFPMGVSYYCAVALENSPNRFVTMVAHRPNGGGLFDPEETSKIEQAVQACMPAFELSTKINKRKATDVLDALEPGAIAAVLDYDGTVLDSNDGFVSLCQQRLIHVRVDKKIDLLSKPNNDALMRALKQNGNSTNKAVVTLGPQRVPWVASILPFPMVGHVPKYIGSKMLLLENPLKERQLDKFLTMEIFGLTRAEVNVASHLFRGLDTNEIAEERCVSVGTVRNMIKSILKKTGSHRQAGLIAKLGLLVK